MAAEARASNSTPRVGTHQRDPGNGAAERRVRRVQRMPQLTLHYRFRWLDDAVMDICLARQALLPAMHCCT